MSAFTVTLIVSSLLAITHGSVLHPIYGYEYSQRAVRPAAYTFALPPYQRSAAAGGGVPLSNPNDGNHKAADCGHLHESEQGEVVQTAAAAALAAYPQQYQQTQWTPVIYSPAPVALNPVVYHSLVGETKIHSWPGGPHLVLHAQPPTRWEGVSPAYGTHHHPQF